MPDTLKEFFNSTIDVTELTGNQTATLFTNNSTTRAVIKDVDVTNTFPVTPNLTVGGTAVASLGSNLTGSEIVDVSQAVAMSFASPLALTSATSIYLTNTSPNTYTSSTAFNINGNTVSTATASQTLPASQSSYTTFVYTAPDGDVFQVATNGDLSWFLYKYAGSASGTQTTVNTGFTGTASAIAFDGVNTFYWLTSTTNIRVFNADTETTTNITIAAVAALSNGSRLTFSNGYLLYCNAINDYPYLIEISTGRWVYFPSTNAQQQLDAVASIPGFWFDTTTRVATIIQFRQAAPAAYYLTVSPPLAAFTAASATISTNNWTVSSATASSFRNVAASTANTHISLYSADGGVIHGSGASNYPHTLSGLSGPTSGWTLSASPLVSLSGATFRPRATSSTSPTVNTANFPSTISLRLTGVEVTA